MPRKKNQELEVEAKRETDQRNVTRKRIRNKTGVEIGTKKMIRTKENRYSGTSLLGHLYTGDTSIQGTPALVQHFF